MAEEQSLLIFNELLRKNQHNAKAISTFLKTADRRYARKMNAQFAHSECRTHLNPPPLLVHQHPTITRNTENSLPKLDEGKQPEALQASSYLYSKQRKQEIKSLLKFVREARQSKLKFYNLHGKKPDHFSETKLVQRAPLHMKNIVFFGEGNHIMELRRTNPMKCSMNMLPLLKADRPNLSTHSNITENA